MRTLNRQLSFLPEVKVLKAARKLRTTDAAYIAGLIDGEGCISAYGTASRHHSVRVEITNTHLPVLMWVQQITGVGTIGVRKLGPRMRKPCYSWICVARKAFEVLVTVSPYLKIKRANAESAIALQRMIMSGAGRPHKGQRRGGNALTIEEIERRSIRAAQVNDRRYLS